MSLSIALIFPELLGTYGDKGNALVLQHRAKLRDIDSDITIVSPGDALPTSADIYLLGGGEDNAQILATDLIQDQIAKLESVIETAQLIAICAGFQILGKQFPIPDGKMRRGLDVIDVTTQVGAPRIIGEVVTECEIEGVSKLTGFENHSGRTALGTASKPLGKVKIGRGNGIETDSGFVDGYLSENIIGTYLHGPLFARNPAFADYVLAKATGTVIDTLNAVEDDRALQLHKERLKAVGTSN